MVLRRSLRPSRTSLQCFQTRRFLPSLHPCNHERDDKNWPESINELTNTAQTTAAAVHDQLVKNSKDPAKSKLRKKSRKLNLPNVRKINVGARRVVGGRPREKIGFIGRTSRVSHPSNKRVITIGLRTMTPSSNPKNLLPWGFMCIF